MGAGIRDKDRFTSLKLLTRLVDHGISTATCPSCLAPTRWAGGRSTHALRSCCKDLAGPEKNLREMCSNRLEREPSRARQLGALHGYGSRVCDGTAPRNSVSTQKSGVILIPPFYMHAPVTHPLWTATLRNPIPHYQKRGRWYVLLSSLAV